MSELRLRRYYGYKKTRVSTKKMLRTIWEFGSSNNDRFLGVNMIFFFTKKQPNSLTFFILISHVFDPPVVECYASYNLHKFYFLDFLLHVTAPFYLYIDTKCVHGVFFWDHTWCGQPDDTDTMVCPLSTCINLWFHCILLFNVLLLLLE